MFFVKGFIFINEKKKKTDLSDDDEDSEFDITSDPGDSYVSI